MPNDKEQLWAQAGQRLASGQRDDGRRFYRVFIQRFPQDPRASQAHLAIGMLFVQESKYPNAAAEFQKVLQDYPTSPEVPEAMWQLSLSFVQLRFCGDAKALLSDLVKRYPKAARAGDARGELKSIPKLPKPRPANPAAPPRAQRGSAHPGGGDLAAGGRGVEGLVDGRDDRGSAGARPSEAIRVLGPDAADLHHRDRDRAADLPTAGPAGPRD